MRKYYPKKGNCTKTLNKYNNVDTHRRKKYNDYHKLVILYGIEILGKRRTCKPMKGQTR